MDINKIMEIADKGYDGDGAVLCQWNEKKRTWRKTPLHGMGDTLARFIAIEISETHDTGQTDEEQLLSAASYIEKAAIQCVNAADALYRAAAKVPSGKRTSPVGDPLPDKDRSERARERRRAVREHLHQIVDAIMEKELS